MTKEEIAGGLKNALERGQSMEEAIYTFVSAGYNPNEVNEAVALINQGGISQIIQQAAAAQATSPMGENSELPAPGAAETPVKSDKKKKILVIALIVLLLSLAGSIIYLTFFK